MIYHRKPWLASYDQGVDAEIEIPSISLKKLLVDTFTAYPDRAAFHFMNEVTSFGRLLEQSGQFAAALYHAGVGKGDVVAINLPNTPQYLIALVGALRAGCAVSGLAPLLMPDEMKYQLNYCSAKVLVTLDVLFDGKLAPIAHKMDHLETILITGLFDSLPGVRDYPAGKSLSNKAVESFYAFMEKTDRSPPELDVEPGDACFIQYTGGTTGPPKGAVLTHGNMVANICQFQHWLKIQHSKEVWLSGFPIFHQAGLFVACCALVWATPQILIPDPRNTGHIIKEIARLQPTVLVNVPSLFLMLLADPEFRKLDFSSLKYCMAGAAPFPVDGIKDLDGLVGANKTIEVWGMTETCPLITANPAKNKKKIGSVGLPLPGTLFRVVSLEDGKTEVPEGSEGELICSGPQVMKGYLNMPGETANALREQDGALWMHTGDVGRIDDEGYVYVVDRAKDMIIVGGYKVFSSEVEDKLYKHPAIGMCAVIGVPNPDRPESEIVKLVVQKSEAYAEKSDQQVQDEIQTFAKEILAPYKVPKIYEFLAEIPLTSVGKINKKSLKPSLKKEPMVIAKGVMK